MYVNWTFRPQWDANQARALINVTLSTTTTTITITASTTIIDITTTTLVASFISSSLVYLGFNTSAVVYVWSKKFLNTYYVKAGMESL